MYFGCTVRKEFKGHGVFVGRVTEYHEDTGYRVEYEDGDSEDLTPNELVKLVGAYAVPPPHPPAAVSQMSKGKGIASITIAEYVRSARFAARRKRKHSELKRSGVLEKRRLETEAKNAEQEAASAVEERTALHKPPTWAADMDREGRAVRYDAAMISTQATLEHDCSVFRLEMHATSPTSAVVHWWYPPANPGNSNSWIGLFNAASITWYGECGDVQSGAAKVAWRLLTRNEKAGKVTFGRLCLGKDGVPDGEYVFTLQADYGVECRALSERFTVKDGKIEGIQEGTALCTDCPEVNRKHRQLGAALSLSLSRSKDAEAEQLDDRCYFPLTAVDISLARNYVDSSTLLRTVYRVCEKESYLDWGLTSDYDLSEPISENGANRTMRNRQGQVTIADLENKPGCTGYSVLPLPSLAQHAKRTNAHCHEDRGLGGGTRGSEGYGEATMGSVHKIGILLKNLRQLVLNDLHDTHWGLLWDLGPHSTFLDLGSGYGKVVLHLALMAKMRRTVGVECVASRHQIACKAFAGVQAESEALLQNQATSSPDESADSPRVPADNESTSTGDTSVDTTELSVPRWARDAFAGVEFQHADATVEAKLLYTHIYIFDWVFSKHTLKKVADVLQRSPFYVMLSFRSCKEWWSHGLVKIQPVAKLQGFRTSGNESMTCFVYINLEKVSDA